MKEGRRKESVLEYERNPSGIPPCKLAEGWVVTVSSQKVEKKKKPVVVLVILVNDSNWQKLMRCRKELATLCTQTGESVGPKDVEFNTRSGFKNNQE